MGKTLITFSQSSNPSSLTKINFPTDTSVTPVSGTLVQVPAASLLVASYALGTILIGYQIQTPSLKSNRVPILIDQVDTTASLPAANIATNNSFFQGFFDTPIGLAPGESLEADVITTAGGATQAIVAYWLDTGGNDTVAPLIGPQGPIVLPGVRTTASTTLSTNAWTSSGTLTPDNSLPVGSYAVIGMQAGSSTTGSSLARIVVAGYPWRMGVISSLSRTGSAVGSLAIRPDVFRMGRFGSGGTGGGAIYSGAYHAWGSFPSTSIPVVELFGQTADTAEVIIFDLVKIA